MKPKILHIRILGFLLLILFVFIPIFLSNCNSDSSVNLKQIEEINKLDIPVPCCNQHNPYTEYQDAQIWSISCGGTLPNCEGASDHLFSINCCRRWWDLYCPYPNCTVRCPQQGEVCPTIDPIGGEK